MGPSEKNILQKEAWNSSHDSKMAALRVHLAEGDEESERGEFVDYSMDHIIHELDNAAMS